MPKLKQQLSQQKSKALLQHLIQMHFIPSGDKTIITAALPDFFSFSRGADSSPPYPL